jgi:hypothetical protein
MLPLIVVLEAPPPKSRTPIDDDTEDENPPESENKVGRVGEIREGGRGGGR